MHAADKAKAAQKLADDYKDKARRFPARPPAGSTRIDPCLIAVPASEFVAQIVRPAPQIYAGAVPLHIVRGTTRCADIQPVFDLQWQFCDSLHGGWTDAPILAQLNEQTNPGGASTPHATFDPFTAGGQFNQWRLRAKVSGQSTAPWSAYALFYTS